MLTTGSSSSSKPPGFYPKYYFVTLRLAQSDIHVTLKVYDILGKEVATLVNEIQKPGLYHFTLSTKHYPLSTGVYFYQLKAGDFIQTKKMIVMK